MLLPAWHNQTKKKDYLQQVLKLHQTLHGQGRARLRPAERRDAGVPRVAASATGRPDTEAEFGRKLAAAIADVVAASPRKRARMISNAPLGLARVAQEAAEEGTSNIAAASATVVKDVAKRGGAAKERHLRGAEAAAKARA